jgi:hypothetical protein
MSLQKITKKSAKFLLFARARKLVWFGKGTWKEAEPRQVSQPVSRRLCERSRMKRLDMGWNSRGEITVNLITRVPAHSLTIPNQGSRQGCGSGLDPDSIGSVDPDPGGQK